MIVTTMGDSNVVTITLICLFSSVAYLDVYFQHYNGSLSLCSAERIFGCLGSPEGL